MPPEVMVLGGGIGGLTAAHELAERGFDVEVFEQRATYGGKARSLPVPGSERAGTEPLPAEHGFRFLPAFYRHTFDTLRRIPYGDNEEGVFGNLSEATQWCIARMGEGEVTVPLELPTVLEEWDTVVEHLIDNPLDIPHEEARFFGDRLLTYLTSCQARREEEFEELPWWEFIRAEEMSEAYRQFFGIGATRSLVAMRAEDSSTRTIGKIYCQLMLGLAMPWLHVDSVLDGPTNDVWLDPWVAYLDQQGVTFNPETRVDRISVADGQVTGVEVTQGTDTRTVTGDYYVAAVPVEVMTDLVTPELADAAPSLSDVDEIETAWMNGIQFYLDDQFPIVHGHVLYQAAPWALTSISQSQFWDVDLSNYGDGDVRDILSICISNWTTPGETVEKPANECTPEEIRREVWHQIVDRLDTEGADLSWDNVVTWFLDPDIEFPAPNETTNAEPLLINTVGSMQYRPEANTQVDNLVLAADYVRTNTDLACMEGANEAARRAVNGIIDDAGVDADHCDVWDLEEPSVFAPMKAYDRLRYRMGLPHQSMEAPPSAE